MRLLVPIELADLCRTERLPATLDNRPAAPFPSNDHSRAAFVAQLLEPYLQLPRAHAQRCRAHDQVSGNYTALSLLLLEKPRLDRSV